MYEKCLELKNVEQLASLNNISAAQQEFKPLECKIFLNDVILNKNLLLEASSRCQLNSINLNEGKQIILRDEDDENETLKVAILEKGEEKVKPDIENFLDAADTQMVVEKALVGEEDIKAEEQTKDAVLAQSESCENQQEEEKKDANESYASECIEGIKTGPTSESAKVDDAQV